MAKLLTGTRIYGTGTVDTQLFVSGTNSATSTTTGALQVVGGVGIGGNLYVGGTLYGATISGTASTATNSDNIKTVLQTSSASHYLAFVDSNNSTAAYEALYTTSSFVINPQSGNIGIGNATPTWKVDANLGTITSPSISTGGYNVTGDATTAVGYTTYNMQLNNSTANASGYMRLARTASTVYLGMQIGSQSRDGIAFLTGATTPAESLRITATGNVGIGTTAPLANLEVSSTASTTVKVTTSGGNTLFRGYEIGATTGDSAVYGSMKMEVNGGELRFTAGYATWGGYQTFLTNGSERLRITALGGISFGASGTAYGVSGQILQSNGNAAPTWISTGSLFAANATTATHLSGGVAGQIPYQTAPGVTSFLSTGTAGDVLVSNGSSAATYNNTLRLAGSTNATSTTSGALQVVGGVGVGGDLFIQGDIRTNDTLFNLINGNATTVNFAGDATTLTMGASGSGTTNVRNNLTVSGNLTVQGTTTIVDSTVTNIADPILTLGGGTGNSAPTADDNKDRGVAFKYVNNAGTTSTGFFGYDDSTGYFTYIASATITNEVVSGTKGAMDVNLAGGTAMSIVYQSSPNNTAFLAASTSGYILQTNGTGSPPTWVSASGVSAGSAANADNIRTIAQTASASYYPTFVDSNNASNAYELVYTTSSFSINPATGFVGVGGQDGSSPLNVKALSTLSGTINSFQKVLTTQASGGVGNNVYRSEWRRRRAAGTDWSTQNIHDGIWVDASFTTPGTDTRTWWDRDPNTPSQAWGDQATTWMFVNSTGLGIGTTNPAVKLAVAGTLGVGEAGSTGARLQITSTAAGAEIFQNDNSPIIFKTLTATQEKMRITDAGNVGIGTSTPAARLDVLSGTGTNGGFQVALTGEAYGPNTTSSRSSIYDLAGTIVRIGANPNSTATGALINFNAYNASNGATGAFVGAVAGSTSNGPAHFVIGRRTAAQTWAETFRITQNGGVSFGTSGTAVGTSGFVLKSNGDAAPTWVDPGSLASASATNADQIRTIAQTASASYYPAFVDSNNASNAYELVYTTSSFSINPATGRVGIGGATSTAKLHVQGTGAVPSPNATTNSNGLLRLRTADAVYVDIGAYGVSPWTTWMQSGDTGSASYYAMAINPLGGNVSIGTTSTDAKLRVDGQVMIYGEGNGVGIDTSTAALARVGLMKYGGYEGMLVAGTGTVLRLGHRTDSGYVFTGGTPTIREDLVITSAGGIAFNGAGNYGTSGQILQSNGNTAPTWVSVVSNATYLAAFDDRIKAPSDDNAGSLRFGFTSFANNNTSPYADYLHLRSYTDASGGNDNLVMFRKDTIGMRIWQQAWGSATAYATYKDVAFTDSSITGSSGQVNTVLQTANASYFPTFVDSNNAAAAAESVYTTSSFQINPSTGNIQIGMTGRDYVPTSGGNHTLRLNALNTSSIGFHDSGSTIGNLKFSGNFGFEIGAGDGLYGPHNTLLWGNVGIGTSAVSTPLAFADSLATKIQFNGNNANGYTIGLASSVNSGDAMMKITAGVTGAGEIGFYNTTNLRLLINNAGNVGIGTSTPQYRLDVNNGVTSANSFQASFGSTFSAGYWSGIHFGYNESVNTSYRKSAIIFERQDSSARGKVHILNNGTASSASATLADAKITILYDGSVGVGTTTPTNKFEVAGTAGQLFSVSDSFTGTIFSANDVSGIPSIEVLDTGLVKLAQYNGAVTIGTGTVSSSTAELSVYGMLYTSGAQGEIRASSEITAYFSSDQRLKENIKLIENPITIIDQIRGVTFDWTDEHMARRGGEDGYFVRKHDIGVIAQEVQAVLPELVGTREDGYLAVKYEKMVPLLIEAIKEQQKTIEKLNTDLKEIKDILKVLTDSNK